LTVATDALRREAARWREVAVTLADIQKAVDGMRFDGVEGGVFALAFVPAYESLVDMVVARCGEGHERLVEIGLALEWTAGSYEEEEATNAAQFQSAAPASP
jgi:hypothetical protein